jgi:hypothetical protein
MGVQDHTEMTYGGRVIRVRFGLCDRGVHVGADGGKE